MRFKADGVTTLMTQEYTSCKIHLLLCCHSIKDKVMCSYCCYFVRNQMTLVAMDTAQLYNQHILWQWTKIENYPSYLDAKQVVPLWHFFAFCLYMWLNTGGGLSFSASYSGTKHVYSSPSAQFIRCILNQSNETVMSPYFLMTFSSLSDAEAEHCCECFCI